MEERRARGPPGNRWPVDVVRPRVPADKRMSEIREQDGTADMATASRRGFLKASGVLMGMLGTSSAFLAMAPSRAWAIELTHLSEEQGKVLMAFSHTLYPHAGLDDAAYALVVKALDNAASDKGTHKMLADGVRNLHLLTGGDFVKASGDTRLAAARAVEGGAFFNTVRGNTVNNLYNNPIAFAHFGYGGSAWEHGGYKHRGFDDLIWLPNPPASASPAKD